MTLYDPECDCPSCQEDRRNDRAARICMAIIVAAGVAGLISATLAMPARGAALTPTLLAILEAERAATVNGPSHGPASTTTAGSVAPQAAVVPAMPDLAPPQPPRPPAVPIIVTGPRVAVPLNSAPRGGRWVRVQRCYGDHCRLEWQWSPQ